MRVLISTIGSRGEVQPVAALASRLRDLDQDIRVCVPPDFQPWIEKLGILTIPLGPPMRPATERSATDEWHLSTPEGRRRAAEDTVTAQFDTLTDAARGCDVLVATGAVVVGARSAAELLGIDYVHAHYCPATVPSTQHPPAPWPGWPQRQTGDNREQWAADARQWNDVWGTPLNAHRDRAGLPPVDDVRGHVLGERPWLAADPVLGPWPEPANPSVLQTGAWLLPDDRPLPSELASFLEAGDAPIYCGLGSMLAPDAEIVTVMVNAARALGRRAIISRGWADLSPADDGEDHIVIGDVNHQALFGRVAVVVHHGGAGTTTTVARSGAPQVVLPQVYDQHYWAGRVEDLGIGIAHRNPAPTVETLSAALRHALSPDVSARAREAAGRVRTDGARIAARHLLDSNRR